MGGAASAIGNVLSGGVDRDVLKQFAPHHYSDSLFEELSGGEATITKASLSMFAMNATDVYLTHGWGSDEFGRSNRDRVAAVDNHLRRLGLKTWFEEVEPLHSNNSKQRAAEAINNTAVAILFITKRYFDVVSSNHQISGANEAVGELPMLEAHCKFEYSRATLTKPADRLIVVAMEQHCLDPSSWPESMRTQLTPMESVMDVINAGSGDKSGNNEYTGLPAIDYTSDNSPADVASEIFKRFKASVPSTVTELLDEELLQELESVDVLPHHFADSSAVLKSLVHLLERQDSRSMHDLQTRRANGNELARAAEVYALLKKTQGSLETNKAAAMDLIASTRLIQWMKAAIDKEGRNSDLTTICAVVLGECCCEGVGCALDRREALKWFEKAASRNHPLAQNALGGFYETAEEDDRSETLAVQWYEKAATQGFALAQCNLAWCYERGIGVSINYAGAARWYRAASEQGCSAGTLGLASCYSNGTGVERDLTEAAYYFRKAADHGSAEAQCMTGICFLEGIGIPQDGKEGIHYIKRAAEQGYTKAMYIMGEVCENGHIVPADMTQALEWYRKAASQGDEEAVEALQRLNKSF